MYLNFFPKRGLATSALAMILCGTLAGADPQHGIAMYGDPQLPPDFVSLPYANADAPTGGTIVTGEVGGFDSLNPHILKGSTPWQLRYLAYESLMGRNWDEPFALYGLLAETIDVGPNREWVEFTLRPQAAFSDGSPVTIEDVMWSYETLGTIGHPRYHGLWGKIASMEQTGERKIKFTFSEDDRELALLVGMRPILKKAQWDGKDFTESGLDTIPISTAPYVIEDFEAGRYVTLKRNPDYWGRTVPVARGTNNLDTVRLEFFSDGTAQFEAFKAGILNSNRETNPVKWDEQYNFPAIDLGEVVKSEIPNARPTGMTGFVMNMRRDIFKDWRVREALISAFNFEYINESIVGSRKQRIKSYFGSSVLGMQEGAATGRVAELLEPFKADLLPGTLEGYTLPQGDGSSRNRANIARATELFEQAGWTVQDGVMKNAEGEPFTFELLLSQGSGEPESMADTYIEALKRLGISPTITVIDSAQYKERTSSFDYDMTYNRFGLSLSPGNEQYSYWGCENAEVPGSRNLIGICDPAAEAMIGTMLSATSRDDFIAATRALDRVLTAGRYAIPFHDQYDVSYIAHAAELHYPERIPAYGDWIGFQPDVWWWEDQ
ncbi:extracellular solute-binding protein [Tropicibacter oceani]|uniref:Extracellular solute-binding protein n=1 Tax=Tropicibacter oceani TaxID=3058420 RepID=A0ABY8QEH7_9RHOB|nr:extracellular solute-binding protein [Tropicibacter oceani]WGW02848.1 extracellular solute-binding protein [Tropicibacter oceani]